MKNRSARLPRRRTMLRLAAGTLAALVILAVAARVYRTGRPTHVGSRGAGTKALTAALDAYRRELGAYPPDVVILGEGSAGNDMSEVLIYCPALPKGRGAGARRRAE